MSLLFSTGVIAASGLGKAAPGMVLLTPTSITHSGTSASIGANGQVTFTAVTSLSLNGVFSADFDNYVVSIRLGNASLQVNVDMRLRASGSDASGASDYVRQFISANGTDVSAGRLTGSATTAVSTYATQRSGAINYFYGPALAQPTAGRWSAGLDLSSAFLVDVAWTHSLSTSYDGFTLIPTGSNITGALQVYGVRS
jgi:hypothetical protein